jgi:hypothetical protein
MGSYVEGQQKRAAGKAYKTAFGVLGPALGMDEATLKSLTGELKSDADWADFGSTMGPFIPSIANAQLGRSRLGVQQSAPAFRAQTNAASQVAAGQGRVTAPPSNINFGVIP